MNLAIFSGRLGKDAELRYTKAGDPVLGFSLAVEERRRGEKSTLWIDCAIGGERGEKLQQYLTKGSAVTVSGRVSVRTFEGRNGVQAVLVLWVNEVTLQGGGGERPQRREPERQQQEEQQRQAAQAQADFDDDIPF